MSAPSIEFHQSEENQIGNGFDKAYNKKCVSLQLVLKANWWQNSGEMEQFVLAFPSFWKRSNKYNLSYEYCRMNEN